MTKNTKILIAVVVIVLVVIFWKQISSLWNGSSNDNASNEKGSMSCEDILAKLKELYGKQYICKDPSKQVECNALKVQMNIYQNLSSKNACGKNSPVQQPAIQFPIQCDPKHYGYDVNGHPRVECGYKYPSQPPSPVPSPNQPTCTQILETIAMIKKKIFQATNSQQLAYLQNALKQYENQYANMDCGGGPRPTTGG